MILKYLAALKAGKQDPALDSPKPLQPGDVVLGTLSGLALALYQDASARVNELQTKHAELLEARAKAVRSCKSEDFDSAETKRGELIVLATRNDVLTQVFRVELAEEFGIVESGVCIGVRKGFKVVKYAGPPADKGITMAAIAVEI